METYGRYYSLYLLNLMNGLQVNQRVKLEEIGLC